MNSFNEAFEDLIKDIYNAEKQVLKALPKVMKKATNEQLKAGIQKHIDQTQGQVQRLEQVAQECGFKPTGKVCKAAQGLIEEVNEHLQEGEPGPIMDAVIISGAQKFEHYEICAYGTAREWAKLLGFNNAVTLLEQTLQEEEAMDKECTQLAESQVNRQAFEAPMPEKKKSASRSSSSRSSSGNGQKKSSGSSSKSGSSGGASKSKSGSRSKAA
jgi:ferritin-like metal-binding protein YciE